MPVASTTCYLLLLLLRQRRLLPLLLLLPACLPFAAAATTTLACVLGRAGRSACVAVRASAGVWGWARQAACSVWQCRVGWWRRRRRWLQAGSRGNDNLAARAQSGFERRPSLLLLLPADAPPFGETPHRCGPVAADGPTSGPPCELDTVAAAGESERARERERTHRESNAGLGDVRGCWQQQPHAGRAPLGGHHHTAPPKPALPNPCQPARPSFAGARRRQAANGGGGPSPHTQHRQAIGVQLCARVFVGWGAELCALVGHSTAHKAAIEPNPPAHTAWAPAMVGCASA